MQAGQIADQQLPVCLSLKTTLCVPPKISGRGYPLTYSSEDITEAVRPWVVARFQGQPWQMPFSSAPRVSIVCLSSPKGLNAKLHTTSETDSGFLHNRQAQKMSSTCNNSDQSPEG